MTTTNGTVLALSVADRWHDFWRGEIGEWIITRGLRIVMLVIAAILIARFVNWAAQRITRRIDADFRESDALVRTETARFQTLSGLLTARCEGDGITLDFPAQPPHRTAPPRGLADALGADPQWVGSNGSDLLVELDSAEVVRSLKPDFHALRAMDVRGVIVTAVSDDPRCDFVSRFFAPRVGVDEDPVTGSAHTALGPFWAHRLERTTLTGYQASPRGGFVGVRMRGDRVDLRGTALTVLRGELTDSAS